MTKLQHTTSIEQLFCGHLQAKRSILLKQRNTPSHFLAAPVVWTMEI